MGGHLDGREEPPVWVRAASGDPRWAAWLSDRVSGPLGGTMGVKSAFSEELGGPDDTCWIEITKRPLRDHGMPPFAVGESWPALTWSINSDLARKSIQ